MIFVGARSLSWVCWSLFEEVETILIVIFTRIHIIFKCAHCDFWAEQINREQLKCGSWFSSNSKRQYTSPKDLTQFIVNEYVVYVSVRVVASNQFAKVTNRLTYQEVERFAIDGTLETRSAYIVHFNWASFLMIVLSSVTEGAVETLFHKNLPTFWNNSPICEIEEIVELFRNKSFHLSTN